MLGEAVPCGVGAQVLRHVGGGEVLREGDRLQHVLVLRELARGDHLHRGPHRGVLALRIPDPAHVRGTVHQVEGHIQRLERRGRSETGGTGADDQHLLAGGDLVVEIGHRGEPSSESCGARCPAPIPGTRLSGGGRWPS
ncbi:hypothetical protein FM106_04460 [Brachybacterium faecium]|nr:hypothetical protein FM106_04460 [Brachybacterium faecium]